MLQAGQIPGKDLRQGKVESQFLIQPCRAFPLALLGPAELIFITILKRQRNERNGSLKMMTNNAAQCDSEQRQKKPCFRHGSNKGGDGYCLPSLKPQ